MFDENILDEIDTREREMLMENGREVAAEVLILDPFSYDQLRYELGLTEGTDLDIYHGYKVVVSHAEYEKCVRFV